MIREIFRNLDYMLLLAVVILVVIGVIMIHSASMGENIETIVGTVTGIIREQVPVFIDYEYVELCAVNYRYDIILISPDKTSNPTRLVAPFATGLFKGNRIRAEFERTNIKDAASLKFISNDEIGSYKPKVLQNSVIDAEGVITKVYKDGK